MPSQVDEVDVFKMSRAHSLLSHKVMPQVYGSQIMKRPGLPIEMAVWHFRAYRSSCTIYSGHIYIYTYYAAVGTGQLDIE